MKNEESAPRLKMSLLFELYHLLLVAGIPIGAVYFYAFLEDLLYPRSAGGFFFFMLFPAILYATLRLLSGEVRPGRVAWNSLVVAAVLGSIAESQKIRILEPAAGLMIYSLVGFTLGWFIIWWKEGKRKARIQRLKEYRAENPDQVLSIKNEAVQVPLAHAYRENDAPNITAKESEQVRGMKPAKMLEERLKYRKSGLQLKLRSPVFRVMYSLYHLVLVGACNYGFLVIAQAMMQDEMRTRLAMALVTLVYPAALCGIVTLLAWEMNALRTFFSCALSSVVLGVFLFSTHPVFLLAFPVACFGYGFLFTLRKEKEWPKVAAETGKKPLVLDPELEIRRKTEKQIERKYRSKRENVRWYRHPWFSR